MNLGPVRSILGADNFSSSADVRLAYSRDASRLEGECLAVSWLTHSEQASALVEWAHGEGVDLVPRGAGTGLCGGATPQGSVVVDTSRLTEIGSVDTTDRSVRVGAGVVLGILNRALSAHGLFLPVIPGSHLTASIGGMIATDAAGLRAVRYGKMRDWVEEVVLVDGVGQRRHLSGDALDDVVGREGVTGFIVEAALRLAPLPAQRSVSLTAFDSEAALLDQRDRWLATPQLTALEYINSHAAATIGWPRRAHLLAEFDSDGGEVTEPDSVAAVWRSRDGLYPVLAAAGYPVIEDPQVGNGMAPLLAWLEVQKIPAFGHLGVGIVHPCFSLEDSREAELYERVSGVGGRVSGEHGIGIKKKAWLDEPSRAEIRRLNASYDPHNIINRGKLC